MRRLHVTRATLLVAAALAFAVPLAAASTPCTLEDLFGDTGEEFQAALGIINFEKASQSAPDPIAGYGIGVDDMYVEWREFTLGPDAVDCAVAGACAAISISPLNVFASDEILTITVVDPTTGVPNDCNDDGDVDDPGDDQDCDDDGVDDVRIRLTSDGEPSGERLVLNEAGGAPAGAAGLRYVGALPITTSFDAEGVLVVDRVGRDTVVAEYVDADDGSGQPCAADVDPAVTPGRITAVAFVSLEGIGGIQIVGTALDDNGDGDGFADTRERVEMRLVLRNGTGTTLTGVTARLGTADPHVACLLSTFATAPDLAPGEIATTTPFAFEVADVDRTALGLDDVDELTAEFGVVVRVDQSDGATQAIPVVVDLDLDASGGGMPGSFFEGFESGTLGTFTSDNMDADTAGLVEGDGLRCQYSDPDWYYSNSYNQSAAQTCYPGNPGGAAEYWWQVVGPGSGPNANRAFGGMHSLYMGVILPDDELTTPLGVLEAVATSEPVNLGWDTVCSTTRTTPCADAADCPAGETCEAVVPELIFRHQVSFVDSRAVGANAGTTADRGVVMAQLADGDTGDAIGSWFKLTPYVNGYDLVNSQQYTNCMFDPTDDGTSEDDFFDPTQPDRRFGPSSTCFPEPVYAWLGDTDAPFAEGNLGRATDGPGLEGDAGLGTWVESRVALARYRGRRLRLRFLNSAIKASNVVTHEALFGWNPTPEDDGWFIDDVEVTDTLGVPAVVGVDDADNSGLPSECGIGCQSASAVLEATPAAPAAPGIPVELRGDASFTDICPGGAYQYRFRRAGALVRGWSADPRYLDAPSRTTAYGLEFRCASAAEACTDAATLVVPVPCPGAIVVTASWDQAAAAGAFSLGVSANYLAAVGDLATLRTGSYAASVTSGLTGSAHPIAGAPADGEWFLFRKAGGTGCNTSWGTTGAGECASPLGTACPAGGRDAALP